MTKELEIQYSCSMWSPQLFKDMTEAHIQATSDATHHIQAATQTLLNVPYRFGEGKKHNIFQTAFSNLSYGPLHSQ